jgi:hypothetical protein
MIILNRYGAAIAALLATIPPSLAGDKGSAQGAPAGVVIDIQSPDATKTPAIKIKRGDKFYPLRQQEILYAGDELIFPPDAGDKTKVEVLVDAKQRVTLDPRKPKLPNTAWSGFEGILPTLVSAYRWLNSGTDEGGLPRNAVSRDVSSERPPTVLPGAQGKLIISTRADPPVWIGWTDGEAPFKVSLSNQGKVIAQVVICADVNSTDDCAREALLSNLPTGSDPIELKVTASDRQNWTATLSREADATASDKNDLGDLGTFLAAVDLLDRGHGEYALESARTLASIRGQYPPARALLERIRKGEIP